jgi:hypothetical protein
MVATAGRRPRRPAEAVGPIVVSLTPPGSADLMLSILNSRHVGWNVTPRLPAPSDP